MNNEIQELCKLVYSINWLGVQVTDAYEEMVLNHAKDELMKRSKEDIIKVMLEVLEARTLRLQFPEDDSPFKDMDQFRYVK